MKIGRVFIFGAGISGSAAYQFCLEHGIEVSIFDENTENLNSFDPKSVVRDWCNFDFKTCNFLILSPGILLSNPVVLKAKDACIPVISDLELYKILAPKSVKIIGISGSNGKSTTVSLLFHILKLVGKNVVLTGNIGISPLSKEAMLAEICIMEVSSFQLESTNFQFDASAMLNITPDHLLYHNGMENYIRAKEKLLLNSKFPVICIDSVETKKIYKKLPNLLPVSVKEVLKVGYSIFNNILYYNGKILTENVVFENLSGEHNLENILVCIVLCLEFCHISLEKILEGVGSFKGLPHRIEFIRILSGVKFINDSKATNAGSCLVALKTIKEKKVFLIAGGRAKEEGIEVLLQTPEFRKVKEVLLIGESSGDFANKIIAYNKRFFERKINYVICGTLEKAVKTAFLSARKNENSVVLFSPLCASFDQFKNYEERGEFFRKFVLELDLVYSITC